METKGKYKVEALQYIAKLSEGGMRDAITLLDKCVAFSAELTIENVVKALGTVDYQIMLNLTDAIINRKEKDVIATIENIHSSGKDVKRFIKQYIHFLLDIEKYKIGCEWKYLNLPRLKQYETWLNKLEDADYDVVDSLLDSLMMLNSQIKYSDTAKLDVEVELMIFMEK